MFVLRDGVFVETGYRIFGDIFPNCGLSSGVTNVYIKYVLWTA